MAFPTTPILDTFNRADGGLGADWTAPMQAQQTPQIYTNAVVGVASDYNSAYWDVEQFGPDCETYFTVPAGATSIDTVYLHAKYRNVGTGTECGYTINYSIAGGGVFYRRYNNAWSGGLATDATNLAPGDKIGLRVTKVGADYVLEMWKDSGSGWTLELSYTDTGAVATYPDLDGPGYSGFMLYGGGLTALTRSLDTFGGGTVATTFPSTPILDSFDRSDGALGANWSTDIAAAGYAAHAVVTNRAAYSGSGSAFLSEWWDTDLFSADQEAYADIVTVGTTNSSRIYVRVQNPGTSTYSGYELEVNNTTSYLGKVVGGSRTSLLNLFTAFAAGDSFGIRVVGNVITAWKKSSGVWTLVAAIRDSDVSGGGYVGLWTQNDSAWVFDNFGGGSLDGELVASFLPASMRMI